MATTKLANKATGNVIKLNVDGTAKEFIVAHQGKPSSIYDDSCNGTWVLMKGIDCKMSFGNSNSYEDSKPHAYLNGAFLEKLDPDILNAVKQVKIPYVAGVGGSSVATGAKGLETKAFLLSVFETGCSSSYASVDGATLGYFVDNGNRFAYYNGKAIGWYSRCPMTGGPMYVWTFEYNSTMIAKACENTIGIRPVMVLDSSLLVSDDGSVQVNVAPTAPASIKVPTTILGAQTVTVQWDEATDANDNLSGYKLERSTDGGSMWEQVYQGSYTSAVTYVPWGTSSVIWRVKAYDTEGEESAYTTSSQVSVINNTAPSTPASISVPTTVEGGKTLTISWAASVDSDGNLSGYKLERSVDGGTFTQIYAGTSISYTDTITKGWNKVQYRVKAYDPYTASGYTVSAERTVINNSAPTITCSYANGFDLGTKSTGLSVLYQVNDADAADSVIVTEKVDNNIKRTFTATKGSGNNFAVTREYFQKVLNGAHTLTIEATDGKATTTHKLTFTKSVTKSVITLKTPMDADDEITVCAISVGRNIPADAAFSVEVTNNAKDSSPVWEDCTTQVLNGNNYAFTNKTAANGWSFNFRVTAERGSSGTGGYITSIQGGFQ